MMGSSPAKSSPAKSSRVLSALARSLRVLVSSSLELFRKPRNRRRRPMQALGIQAGPGGFGRCRAARRAAKIGGLLTHREMRRNMVQRRQKPARCVACSFLRMQPDQVNADAPDCGPLAAKARASGGAINASAGRRAHKPRCGSAAAAVSPQPHRSHRIAPTRTLAVVDVATTGGGKDRARPLSGLLSPSRGAASWAWHDLLLGLFQPCALRLKISDMV
jgi:hypothetical protein